MKNEFSAEKIAAEFCTLRYGSETHKMVRWQEEDLASLLQAWYNFHPELYALLYRELMKLRYCLANNTQLHVAFRIQEIRGDILRVMGFCPELVAFVDDNTAPVPLSSADKADWVYENLFLAQLKMMGLIVKSHKRNQGLYSLAFDKEKDMTSILKWRYCQEPNLVPHGTGWVLLEDYADVLDNRRRDDLPLNCYVPKDYTDLVLSDNYMGSQLMAGQVFHYDQRPDVQAEALQIIRTELTLCQEEGLRKARANAEDDEEYATYSGLIRMVPNGVNDIVEVCAFGYKYGYTLPASNADPRGREIPGQVYDPCSPNLKPNRALLVYAPQNLLVIPGAMDEMYKAIAMLNGTKPYGLTVAQLVALGRGFDRKCHAYKGPWTVKALVEADIINDGIKPYEKLWLRRVAEALANDEYDRWTIPFPNDMSSEAKATIGIITHYSAFLGDCNWLFKVNPVYHDGWDPLGKGREQRKPVKTQIAYGSSSKVVDIIKRQIEAGKIRKSLKDCHCDEIVAELGKSQPEGMLPFFGAYLYHPVQAVTYPINLGYRKYVLVNQKPCKITDEDDAYTGEQKLDKNGVYVQLTDCVSRQVNETGEYQLELEKTYHLVGRKIDEGTTEPPMSRYFVTGLIHEVAARVTQLVMYGLRSQSVQLLNNHDDDVVLPGDIAKVRYFRNLGYWILYQNAEMILGSYLMGLGISHASTPKEAVKQFRWDYVEYRLGHRVDEAEFRRYEDLYFLDNLTWDILKEAMNVA